MRIFLNINSNECAFTFKAPPGFIIDTIVNLSEFTKITHNNLDSFGFRIGCMGGGLLPDYNGSSYSKTLKIWKW